MYKHLSFDLWGTLITSNPGYRLQRNNLIRQIFGPLTDDQIRSNKMKIDSLMVTTGMQPCYDHCIKILTGSEMPYRDFIVASANFAMLNRELVMDVPPLPIEEAIETLKFAAKIANIYLLSNTSFIVGADLRNVLSMYNMLHLFQSTLFSNEFKVCKPNSNFYIKLLPSIGTFSTRVLHIGDDPITDAGSYFANSFIITKDNPITNVLNLI